MQPAGKQGWVAWTLSLLLSVLLTRPARSVPRGGYHDYEDIQVVGMATHGVLTCHRCFLSVHGPACVNLNNSFIASERCDGEGAFCMVRRLKTDDHITTFQRSCAPRCDHGCRVAGSTYRLEECTSCCNTTFCNTDNGRAHVSAAVTGPILLLGLTLLAVIGASL